MGAGWVRWVWGGGWWVMDDAVGVGWWVVAHAWVSCAGPSRASQRVLRWVGWVTGGVTCLGVCWRPLGPAKQAAWPDAPVPLRPSGYTCWVHSMRAVGWAHTSHPNPRPPAPGYSLGGPTSQAASYSVHVPRHARPHAGLPPQGLAPLTKATQRWIYQRQHPGPASCAQQQYLIGGADFGVHLKNGLGSLLHIAGEELSAALQRGRLFVWHAEAGGARFADAGCGRGEPHTNLECFFQAPSSCGVEHATANNSQAYRSAHQLCSRQMAPAAEAGGTSG